MVLAVFWPPLAALSMFVVIVIVLILQFGDKCFGARHKPKPLSYELESRTYTRSVDTSPVQEYKVWSMKWCEQAKPYAICCVKIGEAKIVVIFHRSWCQFYLERNGVCVKILKCFKYSNILYTIVQVIIAFKWIHMKDIRRRNLWLKKLHWIFLHRNKHLCSLVHFIPA